MAGAGCAIQVAFSAGLAWGLWPHLGGWSLPIALFGGMVAAYVTVVAFGALASLGRG